MRVLKYYVKIKHHLRYAHKVNENKVLRGSKMYVKRNKKKWKSCSPLCQTHKPTVISTLQWRHNGRDGDSNLQPRECLFIRLFRYRSKNYQSSASLAFVRGNHQWIHDVIMKLVLQKVDQRYPAFSWAIGPQVNISYAVVCQNSFVNQIFISLGTKIGKFQCSHSSWWKFCR